MPVKGYATRILVDGYDFSGTSNEIKISADNQPFEYYVFQQAAAQAMQGTTKGMIEHSGYFNGPAVGGLEKELYTRLGSTAAIKCAAVIGTDQAIPVAYVIDSTYNQQLTIESPVKDLHTVKGKWPTLVGQMWRGYQLFQGTISGTGSQAPIDLGAIPAGVGKAWLFVSAIGGTASGASIVVQTATTVGMGSPTTRATFTFSAIGAFVADLAAGNRYARINAASMGGATSFTVCAIAGYSGLQY